MIITLPLALMLSGAPDIPAQIDTIIKDARCARVEELRGLYLAAEKASVSPLKPERHREIGIFLAVCTAPPPPPSPANCAATVKMSFLGNADATAPAFELSSAINTVLRLPEVEHIRRRATPELILTLRRVAQVLFDFQLYRTGQAFGADWSAKRQQITAKPRPERTADEAAYLDALERWTTATFLP